MRTAQRFPPMPYTLSLTPQQMLVGIRWLVVAAAGLLELRSEDSRATMLRSTLVMGALLLQQTITFWLATRDTNVQVKRWLLCGDLLSITLATALCSASSVNFFLLYPLLLVDATLTFAPRSAINFTAATSALYVVARMLGAAQGLANWVGNGLVLTLLEAVFFFIVTGLCLNMARSWSEEREHNVQLSLLDDLSLLLADTRRLDDVLGRLVELVPQALNVQACAIAIDEPGSGRRIWANLGADASALIDDALLSREAAFALRAHPQPGITHFPLAHPSYGAIYLLPLAIDERAVGVLSVARVTSQPFGEHDERLLQSLARHAAQALRNARLLRLEAQAALQSRELERFKSEMLASVSHEFRLPLASITLASETLLGHHAQTPPDDPEVRLLRNIHRSAQRLNGFVQDVMDLARLEANRLELRVQSFDLVALARAAIDHLEPQCELKGQQLTLELGLKTCLMQGDEKRVEQVLSNLLTNAYQYTPDGGEIVLALAPTERVHAESPCGPLPPGQTVAISVRDSGPGIPPAEREHIFERFQRGEAGKRRSAGAGLGLHIARSVVELHGGCLWVENNALGGSTFWCILPLVAAHALPTEGNEHETVIGNTRSDTP